MGAVATLLAVAFAGERPVAFVGHPKAVREIKADPDVLRHSEFGADGFKLAGVPVYERNRSFGIQAITDRAKLADYMSECRRA